MAEILIPGDSYRSFNTPAQIQAYAEAVHDRFAYDHGLVSDPHVVEPGRAFGSKKTRKHSYMTSFETLDDVTKFCSFLSLDASQ